MLFPSELAAGRKMSCRVAPLAHTGLKRIPEQTYLGRILAAAAAAGQYVFGTPHGLLLLAKAAQFTEPTAEEYRTLETLEADASELGSNGKAKKVLYGGEAGLREFLAANRP
jgi:hypothetical protein